MEPGSAEQIIERLRSVERRLEALERAHPPAEGQPFEERRVVDLIVDLVEERVARLLARARHDERGRGDDGQDGRGEGGRDGRAERGGCRHCGGGRSHGGRDR